jgi:DNA-directed RNA polymerase subunit omega
LETTKDSHPGGPGPSRYALVVAVAKRAKALREGAVPLVECPSQHPITIALAEIKAGKLILTHEKAEEEAAPAAGGEQAEQPAAEPAEAEPAEGEQTEGDPEGDSEGDAEPEAEAEAEEKDAE